MDLKNINGLKQEEKRVHSSLYETKGALHRQTLEEARRVHRDSPFFPKGGSKRRFLFWIPPRQGAQTESAKRLYAKWAERRDHIAHRAPLAREGAFRARVWWQSAPLKASSEKRGLTALTSSP